LKQHKLISDSLTALKFCQQSLPEDHLDLTHSYNHIEELIEHMGDYPSALSFFQKTLEIQQKTFPLDYPSLEVTSKNIDHVIKKH
jgi:hypothetical protein